VGVVRPAAYLLFTDIELCRSRRRFTLNATALRVMLGRLRGISK